MRLAVLAVEEAVSRPAAQGRWRVREVWLTQGFLDRLGGVFALADGRPIMLRNCRWVHGFGLQRPLFLTFLDCDHVVLGSDIVLVPWSTAGERRASHVVEAYAPLGLPVGCRLLLRSRPAGIGA